MIGSTIALENLSLARTFIFNGLAAMIAPIVGSLFILSGKSYTQDELAAMPDASRTAYFICGKAIYKKSR